VNQSELERLIERLRALPSETEWVEFKENNYDPQTIGEYISALSNAACLHDRDKGYLVYGIQDKTHEVKGTSFRPKQEKINNQEIENWIATQLSPRVDFVIYEFNYKEKPLVLFEIDPTFNTPVAFKGVEYIRVGTYKKKLADFPEKARKIWAKVNVRLFEEEIAIQNIDDDKVLKLIDYPEYFNLMNLPLPPNKDAILEKLAEENITIKEGNSYSITNLGAILYARNLNDFGRLSRKAVRVIIYNGKNRLKTVKEQQGMKGYAVGFEGLIDYINDKLPANEEIGKAFRKEVKMYPELAIRELVANAIIHQDFRETGTGPMIEIFDDRIEITNPGKPLIDTLRFIDHSPKSRNEKLASLMRRINICEERGSGVDKVINEVEMYQLPAPNFIEEDGFLRVIMYAYKPLRDMDKNDKVRATYQHCCLKYVSNEHMTNTSLRERFKIAENNYSMASRIIADTIDLGLIKDYDPDNTSKRYKKYVPIWA
jgi:predicted HTH transcriptional regulator